MLARYLPLIASLLAPCAHALPQVHFILSQDSPAYHAVHDAAERALDGRATTSAALYRETPPDDADILVTLGTRATRAYAASAEPRPVFAALVPARAWTRIRAEAPDGAGPRNVLYLDQPLSRQLAFIRALLPPVRTLGIAYGPTSGALATELESAAPLHNFLLVTMHLRDAGSPADLAASILRSAEVLLALPDPEVYNRYTVQSVLLASFRQRRPVVGFSEAWVDAGALGAVYSTPAQIGAELGGWILDAEDGEARWPARYALRVNRGVAYSLRLTIPSDERIRQQVDLLEARR